jgi:hypothetical protein
MVELFGDKFMTEPGSDGRHRDKAPPKAGGIQQKRGDTFNKNLSKPIPKFRSTDARKSAPVNRKSQRGR